MTWIVLGHLILFQGMFFAKNIITSKKIGATVKGKNREANISILFFVLIYMTVFSVLILKPEFVFLRPMWGTTPVTSVPGVLFLLLSLVVAGTALVEMRESWRVGIKESDEITLVTSGIYGFSRNPYFLSYFLQFLGYIILVPSPAVALLILISAATVQKMVLKEESFLLENVGAEYQNYCASVKRYFGKTRGL